MNPKVEAEVVQKKQESEKDLNLFAILNVKIILLS